MNETWKKQYRVRRSQKHHGYRPLRKAEVEDPLGQAPSRPLVCRSGKTLRKCFRGSTTRARTDVEDRRRLGPGPLRTCGSIEPIPTHQLRTRSSRSQDCSREAEVTIQRTCDVPSCLPKGNHCGNFSSQSQQENTGCNRPATPLPHSAVAMAGSSGRSVAEA